MRTLLFFVCLLTYSTYAQQLYKYPQLNNHSFGNGEQLEYAVTFGIFSVGKAVTKIDPKLYFINGRRCYKIEAYGETSPWISWITKVADQWGAYVDTAAILPQASYRRLREGNYVRDEWVTFKHPNDSAFVKTWDKNTNRYGAPKNYKTPKHVRDVVSGFMYLRVLPFDKTKKGDTLTIAGFLEDESYFLRVLYDGVETIDAKVGKLKCHRLVPVMPANKLFNGENSITCWISADANRIPIKIQAKMFIGSTGVELTSYKGLKYALKNN